VTTEKQCSKKKNMFVFLCFSAPNLQLPGLWQVLFPAVGCHYRRRQLRSHSHRHIHRGQVFATLVLKHWWLLSRPQHKLYTIWVRLRFLSSVCHFSTNTFAVTVLCLCQVQSRVSKDLACVLRFGRKKLFFEGGFQMCVAEIATGIVMAAMFHTSEQTSPLGSGSPMDFQPCLPAF
jgi:hypothetical protein